MKLTLKSLLSVLLAVMMLVTLVPAVMAEGEGDVVVLYTNDVHNAYVRADGVLGYPAVAQRKAELESEGKTVILVDCGDAIQGGVIGSLSKGKYIVSIMKILDMISLFPETTNSISEWTTSLKSQTKHSINTSPATSQVSKQANPCSTRIPSLKPAE